MEIQTSRRIGEIQEYYFSKKRQELEMLSNQGVKVINLGIGSPDLPPPAEMVDMLNEISNKSDSHGYQNYRGSDELRKAISEWYSRYYGVSACSNTEVLPLMGSKEGIMHLSMALLNDGDKVLVPNPGYPVYRAASEMAGAQVLTYSLLEQNNFYPDFDGLEKLDLKGVKLMWVNYPNMPTGTRATLPLFERIIEFGKKHGILICHDNPYSFILNPEPMSILQVEGAGEVAVELNSLSKSHNMAGWRVGMMVGNADVLSAVLRFKTNMDSGMPLPVQLAAVAALACGKEWFSNLNAEYRERQRIAKQIAGELDCTFNPDQSGLFLWVKIPPYMVESETFSGEILKQLGVFITPGTVFGSNGEGYLRISLCSDLNTFNETLQRTRQFNIFR
ncbi:MAG: aminotransferase class I/II-fold pyridoxal phosphate-dependent enzyme [Bacteroidales bacterium]|nr:MAG: aminotransferase class I/II-fold pyridoxal phosphate-dependent enzyme [Bacteroidales bacterium]